MRFNGLGTHSKNNLAVNTVLIKPDTYHNLWRPVKHDYLTTDLYQSNIPSDVSWTLWSDAVTGPRTSSDS